MSQDIHVGFTDANQADTPEVMYGFLDLADAIPEIRQYKRQIRPLLALQPDETLLDVGCGVGHEACRLAAEYPEVQVIGLDRDTMLVEAARRATRIGVDVHWLPGEAAAIPLPDASVDACMTERVLMYLPEPERGVAEMVRVLKPGGRIVSFELDYAATMLGGDPRIARLVVDLLSDSIGTARMGRRLPVLLHYEGLVDVTFQPVAFRTPWAVHEAVISAPVRLAIERGHLPAEPATAWLEQQAAAHAAGLFSVVFIGCLVSGRLPFLPAAA
ncbi:MAG: methyltransferase domain-containing protein [Thermomicrobiales bacterium]